MRITLAVFSIEGKIPEEKEILKNQSRFWKNEKNTCRYYHFTNVYHKWQSMMYCSGDMKYNGQNFLSFWTISCPFTPLTAQKIKILKNWKICLEISFYMCIINDNCTIYGSWDMKHDGQIFFLSFWTVFCCLTLITTRKIKILKK